MENTLNKLNAIFSSAGIDTLPSFDATTMTSSLLLRKENRRLKQRILVQFDFADLQGNHLSGFDVEIEPCELKPIQPCQ